MRGKLYSMTKNLRKLRFSTLCCLLMLEAGVALGQSQPVSELTPFDRCGRIPWDKETDHLDRFADELINTGSYEQHRSEFIERSSMRMQWPSGCRQTDSQVRFITWKRELAGPTKCPSPISPAARAIRSAEVILS